MMIFLSKLERRRLICIFNKRRRYLGNFSFQCVSLSVMVYGVSLGWPSPVLAKMAKTGQPMQLNDNQVTLMVSIIYVTNVLSPVPAGALMDCIGRKQALLLLTLFPLVAWVICLYATDVTWLYVARLLMGVQAGACTTICPTYVAETADAKRRGCMNTIGMFFCFVGIFYEYLVGHLVSYSALCFFNFLVPLVFMILFLMMPDTPYWYIIKGRRDDATAALSWLRGLDEEDVQEELARIEKGVKEQMAKKSGFMQLLKMPGNRRAMIIVLVTTFCQRMSGFGSLMAFGSTALPDLEWATAEQCNLAMGAVWMFAILLAGYLLDKIGRRPLILLSTLGSSFSMAIVGAWFFLDKQNPHLVQAVNWVPFIFLLIYSFLFSTGVGPIALLLPSEMFPANVKANASAFASISIAVSAFVSSVIWLDVIDKIGIYFNFWIFATVSLGSFIFCFFFLIETKGKTLEQIQIELNEKR